MKNKIQRGSVLILFAALLALSLVLNRETFTASAQSGGVYDLTWNTIDGGGVTFATGGAYQLGGTIGQADASSALTGGSYSLAGGFWGQSLARLFLPLITR